MLCWASIAGLNCPRFWSGLPRKKTERLVNIPMIAGSGDHREPCPVLLGIHKDREKARGIMAVKIRERPEESGIWWVFIDHQGKRKAKKIGDDKDLAVEFAKKAEAKLILGDLDLKKPRPKIPIFGEYSQKWLAFIKINRRESTYERYGQILNDHILPQSRGEISGIFW